MADGGAPLLALYRRYRPDTFDAVVGQDHVVQPLTTALQRGRVNHAYLFSGPRGCGKTTSARVLARSLNCVAGPTPTPCGECPSCADLANGGPGSLDVIEIDAASHRGIDDARDLRDRVTFSPVRDRYKVVIIDEAHQITSEGFNALLKVVEEPPEHVVFVFATTEPEKVLGTIRSRTHHYPFRLVPPARLVEHLEDVCRREGVTVDAAALSLVVRAGAGSVRDSMSVLDQLIAGASGDGLDLDLATALLGYVPESLLDDLVDALAAVDGAAAFAAVHRAVEAGHDPRRYTNDLLERLRTLVIVSRVGDSATEVLPEVPQDAFERLRHQASRFGHAELSRAADVVAASLGEMAGATSPRLLLELLVARLLVVGADADGGVGARVDRLERQLSALTSGGALPAAQHTTDGPRRGPSSPASAAAPAARPTGPSRAAQPAAPEERTLPTGPSRTAQPAEPARPTGPSRPSEHGPRAEPDRPAAPDRPVEPDRPVAPDRPDETARAPRRGSGRPTPVPQPAPSGPQPPGSTVAAAAPPPAAAPEQPVTAQEEHGGITVEVVRRTWDQVVDRLRSIRRLTWTLVSENAQVLALDGSHLTLGFPTQGLADAFNQRGHADCVREAVLDTLGVDRAVVGVTGGRAAQQGGAAHHDGAAQQGGAAAPATREDPSPDDAAAPAADGDREGAPAAPAGASPAHGSGGPAPGPEIGPDGWPVVTGPAARSVQETTPEPDVEPGWAGTWTDPANGRGGGARPDQPAPDTDPGQAERSPGDAVDQSQRVGGPRLEPVPPPPPVDDVVSLDDPNADTEPGGGTEVLTRLLGAQVIEERPSQ